MKTLIYAHRGASGLVPHENTLEAFQKAIDVKADGVELDIRETKDGVIVVNHNADIDGMMIVDHTYSELDEKTQSLGYHLATLEEAVKLCKGKMFMDIEVKEPGFEAKAMDIVTSYLSLQEFHCRSFNYKALSNLKKYNKDIFTILLLGHPGKDFKQLIRHVFPLKLINSVNADGVSPHYKLVKLGYKGRMKRAHKELSLWTINNEATMRKFLKMGVDIIITNYPDKAMELRKEIQGE